MKVSNSDLAVFLVGVTAVRSQEYPNLRFTVYSDLSTAARAASLALGYIGDTWNIPGTAQVEKFAYETLVNFNPTVTNPLETIELNDEDTWDCYMNHYDDYDWSELVEFDLAAPMQVLGWTRNMWDFGVSEAITEDMEWNQLSDEQQEAAELICFSQETWEMESLTVWGASQSTRPACFSGNNLIETKAGTMRMEDLSIGDYVKTGTPYHKYTRVYSISHVDPNAKIRYHQIYHTGKESPLEITRDHLMYANGKIVRADQVKVGDMLSSNTTVSHISLAFITGLYAPLTETGTLLVSGATVSNFVAMTEVLSPAFQHHAAHSALAPVRWLCKADFDFCRFQSYTGSRSTFVHRPIQWLTALVQMPSYVQVGAAVVSTPLLGLFFLFENYWPILLCEIVAIMRYRSM